jgi:integrase
MKVKLHKRSVEASKPGFLWDTELTGFGLKTTNNGKKVFVVQKRPHKGARTLKRYTIGAYPSVSPEEARTQAKALLGRITLGLPSSPVLGHPEVRFSESMEKYYHEHVQTKCKPSTQKDMRYMIDKHILPTFGKLSLDSVDHLMVRSFHTALGSKHPYRANRVLALLSRFFSWVNPHSVTPTKGVEKFREKKRNRLMTAEEFQTVLGAAPPPLLLLALTGMRKSEVLSLRWSEVDLDQGVLQLEDSKTGSRTVYLDTNAQAILRQLPRAASPWVFPSTRGNNGGHLVGIQKIWKKVLRDAGLSNDIRIHDLRHHYASLAARELPLPLVMSLLGHHEVRTTMGYCHSNLNDLKKGSQLLGDKLSDLR